MGKDKNGTFHPGKGKPSGINKEEGLGIQSSSIEHMQEYEEITEKYTSGEDTLAEGVPLRHQNRNTSKGHEKHKPKETDSKEKEGLVNANSNRQLPNHDAIEDLTRTQTAGEYFYLLVISKKVAKLYKCNHENIEPVEVQGMPAGLAEELGDTDVATTFRTGGRGGTGGANFHGLGGGNNNDDKAYLTNYLDHVDKCIWKQILHNENAPLLLAGVEYLIPIYRSISNYNHVWTEALTGSLEHDELHHLHNVATKIMEPYFQKRLNDSLEQFGNQIGNGLSKTSIEEIIPATYYGRVWKLFVERGKIITGTFDEINNELNLVRDNSSPNLIDLAVIKTMETGGEVFVVEKERMPSETGLAAIFRY